MALPGTMYVASAFLRRHRIPDFHHAFLIVEIVYLLLALFLWTATWGVWADNRPDEV
jgi:hypothetical protein